MTSMSTAVLRASAGRDRVVDGVKGAALLLVVVGHNLAWVTLPDGSVQTVLDAAPWTAALTWVLQIIPLFMVMAGIGLRRLEGRPARATYARIARLTVPTLPLLATTALLAALVARIAGPSMATVAGVLPTQLLWFIGVYLLIIACAPLIIRVHRPWQFVVWLTAIAGVDWVRIHVWAPAGWLNLLLVWALFTALGSNINALKRVPRWQLLATIVLCGAAAFTLVALGPYSRALISTDAVPGISNLAPPTVVLALVGSVQTCVLLLVWNALHRLLARDRVWVPVAVLSSRAMELYLWHVLLMSLLIAAVLALGLAPPALSVGWWALHLTVLAIDAGVLFALAPALRRAAEALGARLASWVPAATASRLASSPRGWSAALAFILGITVLLVSEGGLADLLTPRVVIVLPYIPSIALAVIAVGTAVAARVAETPHSDSH